MKILAVDIGTGTQDVLLFDSRLDVENSFKWVIPSPTMRVRAKVRAATKRGAVIALTGVTMGGGPSGWAVEDHLRAGLAVYADPDAARTLNDDLDAVSALGVNLLSEEEIARLPESVERIEFRDFDFPALSRALGEFGLSLEGLDAVAVAVFDHGAAPPEVSDRKFRFDYLDERIRAENRLSAFAYPAERIPADLTRLRAVARSAAQSGAPLVVMDTAPAAVLGARMDPIAARLERAVFANVGNFHTLAFRLGPNGIEGVFEHHTGLIDRPRLEDLLNRLAGGTLTNADVFDSNGHGALVYDARPFDLLGGGVRLVVTGPRRSMLAGSELRPYFAVPYGDMMIAGCFGLLAAVGDVFPDLHDPIEHALRGGNGTAPWEAE